MKEILFALLILSSGPIYGKCRNVDKVINIGSELITNTFECDYRKRIKEDIVQSIHVTELCNTKWPFNNIKESTACKVLGKYTSIMIVNGVPQTWGCHYIPEEGIAQALGKDIAKDCLRSL